MGSDRLWLLQCAAASVVAFVLFLFALPRKWGERMLEHSFNKRLAEHKRQQNEQIEGLKERLNHLGDRAKRSNELEYAAAREVWNAYVEAHLATLRCVVQYIKSPDLDRESDEDVASYLEGTDLSEGQRKFVLEARDKNRAFARVVQSRTLMQAQNAIYDLRLLLRKNGIFLPESLKASFDAGVQAMSMAQSEQSIKFDHGPEMGRDLKHAIEFLETGDRKLEELMAETRERLLRAD